MEHIFAAIILTACMGFGLFLRYAPFNSVVGLQRKKLIIIIESALSVVNIIVIYLGSSKMGVEFVFDYLRYGGIIFATLASSVNTILIPGRLREHLFVYGIVLNFNYILMTIPNYVITHMGLTNTFAIVELVLIMFLLLLAVSFVPLRKLLCKTVRPYLHLNASRFWRTVCFIPIAYFISSYCHTLGGRHDVGTLLQIISHVFSGLIMILLCMSAAAVQGRLQENQDLEKSLNAQKVHFSELRARVEDARKIRHDFKHHVAVIRRFMELDDKEGLGRYCDEWLIQAEETGRIPFTGNSAVDGVLYQYAKQAERDGVEFRYMGTVKNNGVGDMDLCALIGNALENAFTACNGCENKSVTFLCQSEENLMSIVVNNTFDGNVIQQDDVIYSRKRENRTGVGLTTMKAICERYGGSLDIQWDDETFTVMAMLPLIKEE